MKSTPAESIVSDPIKMEVITEAFDTPLPPPNNAFSRLLAEFRDGASLAELSSELQKLVAAVQSSNRPGSLTYTIKLAPSSNAMLVSDDIKVKAPAEDREKAIFFSTEEHTLQRNNPAQREFQLKELPKPTNPEVREMSAAAQ